MAKTARIKESCNILLCCCHFSDVRLNAFIYFCFFTKGHVLILLFSIVISIFVRWKMENDVAVEYVEKTLIYFSTVAAAVA